MNAFKNDSEKILFCNKPENKLSDACSCMNFRITEENKNKFFKRYQSVFCWLPQCRYPNAILTSSIQNEINSCKSVFCYLNIKKLNITESGKVDFENSCTNYSSPKPQVQNNIKTYTPKKRLEFNIFWFIIALCSMVLFFFIL
ncbi:putative late 16kDa membrane protein (Cop-J5L) [Carp edema virus]|nr:putative late 16kDa membrane protein (Cop-J5L) [Carp edema virus]